MYDFWVGGFLGAIFVLLVMFLMLPLAINSVNINHEAGYTELNVTKITKYSDGFQEIKTTARSTVFSVPTGNYYTYADPQGLIKETGIHKVRLNGNTREITSVISIVEIIDASSQDDNGGDHDADLL